MILTWFCLFLFLFSVAGAVDYGTLSGHVCWEGGHGSIVNAKIIVYNRAGETFDSTFADASGSFRLNLPADKYLVSAEKENLVKEFYPSEYLLKEADEIRISVGQNVGLRFELDYGGWISGNFAFQGDNAVSGLVTAIKIDEPNEGWHKSVSLRGPFPSAYDISGLLPGTYKILGRARGKSTEYYPGVERFEDATPILIVGDIGVSDISFTLDQVGWGFIQGRVTDQATGAGMDGIPVYAFQWQNYWEDPNLMTAVTCADGGYVLNVPAGHYYLFSSYPDVEHGGDFMALYYNNRYDPTYADIVAVAGDETRTGIDFMIDFSTPHNLSISGEIIGERTGRGIDDIIVTAIEYTTGSAVGSACSVNDGLFSINGLAPGQYLLMFSGPQIIPFFYSHTGSWQQGEIIQLNGHFSNIRTEAITQDYGNFGLAVTGQVVTSEGPVSGARIYAYRENETEPIAFAWSGASGEYTISTGLVPGWYYIMCDLYGYQSQYYPEAIYLDLASNPEAGNIDFHLVRSSTGIAAMSRDGAGTIIDGNYPNPFNSSTSIVVRSGLDVETASAITVYNVVGQMVGRKNITLFPGDNSIIWGADDFGAGVTSGIYFYKFDGIGSTYRMVFLK